MTPRAYFSVKAQPFGIGFFFFDDVLPLPSLEAIAWPMNLFPALETESCFTLAGDLLEGRLFAADAFVAVDSGTEFHFVVSLHVLLSQILVIEYELGVGVFHEFFNDGANHRCFASFSHAREEYNFVGEVFEGEVLPTVPAEFMSAAHVDKAGIYLGTDMAHGLLFLDLVLLACVVHALEKLDLVLKVLLLALVQVPAAVRKQDQIPVKPDVEYLLQLIKLAAERLQDVIHWYNLIGATILSCQACLS